MLLLLAIDHIYYMCLLLNHVLRKKNEATEAKMVSHSKRASEMTFQM